MRVFGPPIAADVYARICGEVTAVFGLMPDKKPVFGEALAMEETDMVVLEVAQVKDEAGNVFKISFTKAVARPPFEWLIEISSDLGESEYFKHYLVREDDIVLAQRKVLTPIDDEEAKIIMADLAEARTIIALLEATS